MKHTFWIPGPLPGLNEIIDACKNNAHAYGKMKKQWANHCAWHIKAARVPKMSRVFAEFHWVSSDKRHDPDNIEAAQKFIWDALGARWARVLPNDGWSQNAGTSHRHSVGKSPGVTVTLDDRSGELDDR